MGRPIARQLRVDQDATWRVMGIDIKINSDMAVPTMILVGCVYLYFYVISAETPDGVIMDA